MLRPDETWHRLRDWTMGQAPSERLSAQVLYFEGYREIDPSHPLGGKDGGKDAIVYRDGQKWVMASFFPRGQQSLKEIIDKVTGDGLGVAKNGAVGLAFVTNQELKLSERQSVKDAIDSQIDLFHLERIVTVLDNPLMHGLRRQFLGIDSDSVSVDSVPLDERLVAALRSADVRRKQRLIGAGVPQAEIENVLTWMVSPPVLAARPPLAEGTLTIVVAPMGSGKSEFAHDWYVAKINRALADASRPIPIWLRAREIGVRSVVESIRSSFGADGLIFKRGCSLVVDGIDEVEESSARQIVESAEEFCAMHSESTVVVTSKPGYGIKVANTLELAEWPFDLGYELAQIVAGDDNKIGPALRAEVADLYRRPLFAIAVGAARRVDHTTDLSRPRLLSQLAERSLRTAGVQLTTATERALIDLASRLVQEDGKVQLRSVDLDDCKAMLGTKIVVENEDRLEFTLPVLELSFAARAVRSSTTLQSKVATQSFSRWRYALAFAIEAAEPQESESIFCGVANLNPAAASWILTEIAVHHETRSASPLATYVNVSDAWPAVVIDDDLDKEIVEIVLPLRCTYSLWWSNIPVLAARAMAGWDVDLSSNRLTIAERLTADGVDLRHLNAFSWSFTGHLGANFVSLSDESAPTGRWAHWTWSRKRIQKDIQQLVEHLMLQTSTGGPADHELAWTVAQVLVRGRANDFTQAPVELDPVRRFFTTLNDSPRPIVINDLFVTEGALNVLRTTLLGSARELVRPAPAPDVLDSNIGWVWSIYSTERILSFLTVVLENAITIYWELIDQNFGSMATTLPSRDRDDKLIGILNYNDRLDVQDYSDGPWLSYAFVKRDELAPRVEIRHRIEHQSVRQALGSEFNTVVKSWSSTAVDLRDSRPATKWAYHWLVNELSNFDLLDSRMMKFKPF